MRKYIPLITVFVVGYMIAKATTKQNTSYYIPQTGGTFDSDIQKIIGIRTTVGYI